MEIYTPMALSEISSSCIRLAFSLPALTAAYISQGLCSDKNL